MVRLVRSSRSRSNGPRGFTLVELLVSCVIIAIGLVALSQLYIAGLRLHEKARYVSLATQRLQYELEHVENLKFNILTNSANLIGDTRYRASDGYTELSGNNGVAFPVTDLPNGQGTVTVASYHNYPSLLQVTIQITWAGARDTASPVKVVTLLAK